MAEEAHIHTGKPLRALEQSSFKLGSDVDEVMGLRVLYPGIRRQGGGFVSSAY